MEVFVFTLMIAGAIKVNMATGSETLVKTDNDAYISNFAMEQEFGGGLSNSSQGLKEIFLQLDQLGETMEGNPELAQSLSIFSEKINQSSMGLSTMSENTAKLSQGNENTSQALTNIDRKSVV